MRMLDMVARRLSGTSGAWCSCSASAARERLGCRQESAGVSAGMFTGVGPTNQAWQEDGARRARSRDALAQWVMFAHAVSARERLL